MLFTTSTVWVEKNFYDTELNLKIAFSFYFACDHKLEQNKLKMLIFTSYLFV